MFRALATLALLAVLPVCADAQTRADQPRPAALPFAGQEGAGGSSEAGHAAAQARQDAFDRRIKTTSDRAVRSICVGCDTASARVHPKRALRREVAQPMPKDDDADIGAEELDGAAE